VKKRLYAGNPFLFASSFSDTCGRADVLDRFGGGEMHARHLARVSFFRSSLIRDCQPSP
jgi:hypothetical protein